MINMSRANFLSTMLMVTLTASMFGIVSVQAQDQTCETCGMTVDSVGEARYGIVDANGGTHVACCPVCAFKMLKNYENLNITTFCDYNGPDYPIIITAKNHGSETTVTPSTAIVIVGGSCTKNRVVYDPAAADKLLSPPNNGTSKWLSPLSNDTVPMNATRLGVSQAAIKFSGFTPTPGECEVCGMGVSAESQIRYKVTDENGSKHYVECFMCALSLISDYETLHIETTCDWYGPGYLITVESTDYGHTLTVNPSTAIFLRGGSCVTARAAYNQTAADNLLANGFSSYTSPEQQYAMPPSTEVKLVAEAIETWYAKPDGSGFPTVFTFILIAVPGVAAIVISILAFNRLKRSQKENELQRGRQSVNAACAGVVEKGRRKELFSAYPKSLVDRKFEVRSFNWIHVGGKMIDRKYLRCC